MKSFLQQLEEAFELYEESDELIQDSTNEEDDADLEEQNVTGAIAGYSTPNAFRKKTKKVGYATGIEESVNTPPSFRYDKETFQRPESHEAEMMEKFAYSGDGQTWYHEKYEYPSIDLTDKPGQSKRKDQTKKVSLVAEAMDRKYEQLIEGYRSFANGDPKKSPEQKVKHTIREIAQKLREIEKLVEYNSKLKTESGVTSTAYGPSTTKALTEISRRLIKISERVRSLGE